MNKTKMLFLGAGLAALSLSSCDKETFKTYPNGFKKAKYTESFFKLYGGLGNNDDEMVSGMVMDASGNAYFNLNTNDASANKNVIIAKVTPQGTLAWSKMWDGNYMDISPDSGENGETGGTAGSISMDASGNIYVVITCADVPQNNFASVVVLKINGNDGSLIWEKKWKHRWPATGGSVLGNMDAWGYALDASVGNYVYITGSNGDNRVPVVALNKSDGSLFFQTAIDVTPGTKDRGYAIRADQSGNIFVGGVTGAQPYLAKLTGGNTATPSLAWVKRVDLGFGGRINDLALDGSDLYVSCDRRGATTYFSVLKLNADGGLQWGRTFPGTNGDRNNTHVVRVLGNHVYVGGRTGQTGLDTQIGDGLLVKMDKSGNLVWSGIYFTGTLNTEIVEHRIKGFGLMGSDLVVVGQSYSGNDNVDNLTGDWLTKDMALETYSPGISNNNGAELFPVTEGSVRDAAGNYETASSPFEFLDASAKTVSNPPDGDLFITKLKLD